MSTRAGSPDGAFWGDVNDEVALRRYRTLVNTIGDGVYQLDSNGHFVAVNDVIIETTGYSREELLGEDVSLVLTDDDIAHIEREIKNQIETENENIVIFELGVQAADGDVVPCELRINPLIEEGEFQGSIGVVRDVSEQKQRVATLESAQASYDSITSVLDEANIGVFILDAEFEVAWADETIEQYFGLDRDDLIGRDKRQVVHELVADTVDDPDRFAETVLATYDDNSYIEEFECRVTASDNREERWLEHQSKPIESGQYAGGRIELYYDITDQKRSEDARRKTEGRFRSLVDAVEEDAIFRLDPKGHVASWNEGAKEIKGYESEEILGEHVSTFYTEEDRATGTPERHLERAAKTGSIGDEGWRVRKDGTRFWANVTITAVHDEDGTPQGYLKVARDMTERHEREQELESELQRVFGRISDAFYAVDEDFRFTHVNKRAEELLQRSTEELIGEKVWEMFPESRNTHGYEAFHQALETQKAVSYEETLPTLGGWFEVRVYPSETGLSVYFRDITERKQREQAIRESERRYRTLVENFPNGVVTQFDEELRYTLAEGQAFDYLPHSPDDVEGRHLHEVWADDVVETIEPAFRAALEGETQSVEGTSEGREWILHVVPLADQDGEIHGGMTMALDITERKERERELAKYETIVETVNDGIYTVDEEGRFIMVNDAYTELTGYSREELLGSHVSLVADEDTIERATVLEEVIAEGSVDEPVMEATLRTADGGRVPAEATFAMLPGDERERIGVARDITERKQRERALKESEARFRMLAENLEEMVWIETPDTRELLYINPAAETIWGRDREWLYENPTSFLETVHPDDHQRVEQAYEAVPDDGFDEEYRIVRPDDEVRWLDVQAVPVHNEERQIRRIVGIVDDITERKERERALEESELRYRTLVEHFPNGAVGLYDEDLTYSVAGGELIDDLGFSPDEIVGTTIYGRYPDELIDRIKPYFRAVFDGESSTFDIDLDERHLLAHTLPVRNADNEVYAGTVVVQDITELREYQRKLEESNERLEQFAYAASHDLQEPLRMVSSYLQLVDRRYADALDEDGREFLAFAVDGAERMRAMIDGLLEYSRIETRGDPFEPVDLNNVLDDVREDLRMRIDESNAEITTDDLPCVDGDDSQLRQVFQNLLSNAIEYSEDEPPQVDISATRRGDQWIISVQDNGIGIDPDEQDRIFEVFQRLHTHEEHSGMGIGLALSRRIVERHGGEIWVDSEPDEGSTFSFTLSTVDT
ncbi:PAS domain-containing sensor histidine kinase [Natronorubrum bangense]|uniref:histidine kinase n=2 Tax=Natronorubrum bangense TaxID=61858 RepID=L9WC86_9EURY|nr:PAS domain S-box protein [Natronorubrum bangense]ELY46972.1 PAS/PAC sensor signal transduction histidine kinase [Natronorubrum bangense JCM 10635]QCC56441.1 PAS domain-containing sensor histidine kinase [Natronorubrum bangense]